MVQRGAQRLLEVIRERVREGEAGRNRKRERERVGVCISLRE